MDQEIKDGTPSEEAGTKGEEGGTPSEASRGADAPVAPIAPGRLTRIVRRSSPEFREYLRARFAPGTGYSFQFMGHRWAYDYSSFDDAGEFDVLGRPAPVPGLPSSDPLLGEMVEALRDASFCCKLGSELLELAGLDSKDRIEAYKRLFDAYCKGYATLTKYEARHAQP